MAAGPPVSGLLVSFEGIDGCGKSSQITRCQAWLASRQPRREVAVFREPGGTPLGERVREILLHGDSVSGAAETLLYMAARAELYATEVLPLLERGALVLLDRSYYSTAAYQGAGLGQDEAWIFDLARRVTAGRAPDRVLVLDLPPEAAAARRAAPVATRRAGADRIERRGSEYFARVAEAYRRYAASDPRRLRLVEATGSPEEVFTRVQRALGDVV